MYLYFLLIRIAALFGHRKARLLVNGQKASLRMGHDGQWSGLKGCVWIHAASVGEFEQARPLIERLRREQPYTKIIVTFFSPSGYELRKNYSQVDGVFYLPFATRRNARLFLDALQPAMAIFVKYEFWPAYLRELKKRGIPTYSISAIFRPTQRFFRWYGKAALKLLDCFTHIYVQDEASLQLLQTHGIAQCSVAGDTRFDRVAQVMESISGDSVAEKLRPVEWFVNGCRNVIVAGSTWPKDEELLCRAMAGIEGAKLILVPHETDPEHLHFIFNLFKGRMVRYSTLASQEHLPLIQREDKREFSPSVLLIDTIGLLSSVYRFGQVGYIGGGFGVGIHNTIEAAVYGIPVIFGPNYRHFREAKGLIDAGAARSIKNQHELELALQTALTRHQEIGEKAAEYVRSETGATSIIFKELFNH